MTRYSELIRKYPDCDIYLTGRAAIYEKAGEYERAIKDYRAVVALHSDLQEPHCRLAWILATCPKSECRNGKEAIEHALKCDLDTKAVAYAEAGDFENAVACEEKFLKILKIPSYRKARARERLALFQARKAYHGLAEPL